MELRTISEEFKHISVMKEEALEYLDCKKGLIYVDATLGGGGHSLEIAKKISPSGKLISFDLDEVAIENAKKKLDGFENVTIVKSNYSQIPEILRNLNIDKITGGVLFDLGTSYYQLTSEERGFSFSKNSRLDMRFSLDSDFSAHDVVNSYPEQELVRIFSEYGEERFSKRIAKAIIEQRKTKTINTTGELANLVISSTPKVKSHLHPATRVFQAIRIEVNDEIENLKNSLEKVVPILEKGAKIVVITFHSLEDRVVKQVFKRLSSSCNCEPHQMVCHCEPKKLDLLTKKPVLPTLGEVEKNAPSRSAKLRAAVRV